MTTRTRVALLAGLFVFVAGSAGAAYLMGNRGSGTKADAAKVQVLFAVGPVDAGMSGSTALAEGRIVTKAVDPSARPLSAAGAEQISSQVATTAIAEGGIVTTEMFADPQTRIGTVLIPPGKRALALELASVPGIAGFAGAGDRIDVYGVAKGEEGVKPEVRLVLQSVEVLNVNGTGLPAAQGQTGGPNLVYLVAVTPAEAERLIFLAEFRKLYFDLVPKGEAPVITPGAGPELALKPGV